MSWIPPVCDVCKNPALHISYKVRVFRMVTGQRACSFCMRRADVRWLVARAYGPWLSDSVSIDWVPPAWIFRLVEP